MKRIASCLVLLLAASCAVLAAPDTPASHFDQLKKLAGTWEGKTAGGKPVSVTFQVVSDGSALMQLDQGESMVTVYRPDNDRLLMTHYCSCPQPAAHAGRGLARRQTVRLQLPRRHQPGQARCLATCSALHWS